VGVNLKGIILIKPGSNSIIDLKFDVMILVGDKDVFVKLDFLVEGDFSAVFKFHIALHSNIVSEYDVTIIIGKVVVQATHSCGGIECGHTIGITVKFNVLIEDNVVVKENTVLESRDVIEVASRTKSCITKHRQAVTIGALKVTMEGAGFMDITFQFFNGAILHFDLVFQCLDSGIGIVDLLGKEQNDILKLH